MSHKLYHFHGGIKVADYKKDLSCYQPVKELALPSTLIIPMCQHIGSPAKPIVEVGQQVLKGEIIGKSQAGVSANIHASSSGVISAIKPAPFMHPSGLECLSVFIETDGLDKSIDYTKDEDIVNCIQQAGIVGLGGAGFPSNIKALGGIKNKIKTLMINGVECEPYISCDGRLMQDKPEQIISGIKILAGLFEPDEILLAVEDNKPQAIKALTAKLENKIQLVTIPTVYPSGGERQLAKILTNTDLTSKVIPADVGILCFNVATCYAVDEAVNFGKPLIERIVTITGDDFADSGNYKLRIGTPLSFIQQELGIKADTKTICGGPMMGFAIQHNDTPLSKTCNCLLLVAERDSTDIMSCIKCARCVDACPVRLLPQELYWYAKAENFDKTKNYNLFDCIECGCCSYVCPSNIPLVQYYKIAKGKIRQLAQKKLKSDKAKQRHEKRELRLERLKRERKEKMAKQRAAIKKKADTNKEELIKKAQERHQS